MDIDVLFSQVDEGYDDWYKKSFLYYKPHEKQKNFHALGLNSKERLFLAGNRTGKSFSGAMETSMHLTGHYPSWWKGKEFKKAINAWVIGTTNDQVKTTLQKYYIGDPLTGDDGAIHPSLIIKKTSKAGIGGAVDTVYIMHASGDISTLSFKSYQQGREALQSARVDVVHADEEPPYNIYTELLMRLMSFSDSQDSILMITCTPLLGMTEVVNGFLSKNDVQVKENEIVSGKSYIQASWGDNPYLMESERDRLRSILSPHEIECREKGIPSIGSGMVYPVSETSLTCTPFEIPDFWPRFFALDFGWNCTAALFGAYDRDNSTAYFYAEYYRGELTPEVHARDLIRMDANWIPGVYDPAGLQSNQRDGENFFNAYRACGVNLVQKADNSKEYGLHSVLTMMQRGQLKIFSSLNNFWKEFRLYARDEKGVPKKGNDHLMDCMRYGITSGLSVARTSSSFDPIFNTQRENTYFT